jgi:hypothetical protein
MENGINGNNKNNGKMQYNESYSIMQFVENYKEIEK